MLSSLAILIQNIRLLTLRKEQEKARTEYLDLKGYHKDFRCDILVISRIQGVARSCYGKKESKCFYLKHTLSIAKGKGSIGHNLREFIVENIDPDRSKFNIGFVHEIFMICTINCLILPLKSTTKSKSKMIEEFLIIYEKIRTSKQEKLFYEIIAQVGNYEDLSATDENGKITEEILGKYMEDFQNPPTLYVFSAHLHMDEATPHLHIDFVPHTTGNKRGFKTKKSKRCIGEIRIYGGHSW